MSLTFVSLFSGVGGFDLGLEAAGWQCVAQVEWDTQCQQVLARHWPDVPRWGDVSTVSGADLPAADVVAFGSPCQDLSVAGKRAGLDGDRSGLFFEAIRIIKEMRDATAGTQPWFVIWENVAGALSSSGGWDFAAVIDSLAELGALDISWRILDARWFGVPQRRRRVFVVADFAGQCAGAIHAERAGVPWHPRSSRAQRQVAATGTGTGVATGGEHLTVYGQTQFAGYTEGINTLAATTYKRANDNIVVPTHTHTHTLTAGLGSGGPDFAHAAAGWLVGFSTGSRDSGTADDQSWRHEDDGHRRSDLGGDQMTTFGFKPMQGSQAHSLGIEDEIAPTLSAASGGNQVPAVFTKAKRASSPTDEESWVPGEVSPTLNSFDNAGESRATVVAISENQRGELVTTDYAHQLVTGGGKPGSGYPAVMAFHPTQTPISGDVSPALGTTSGGMGVTHATAVRRLTPTECERLMGWPDDHTRWRADGTELADSTRYRMCGNGVASPVAEWLADMINMALAGEA